MGNAWPLVQLISFLTTWTRFDVYFYNTFNSVPLWLFFTHVCIVFLIPTWPLNAKNFMAGTIWNKKLPTKSVVGSCLNTYVFSIIFGSTSGRRRSSYHIPVVTIAIINPIEVRVKIHFDSLSMDQIPNSRIFVQMCFSLSWSIMRIAVDITSKDLRWLRQLRSQIVWSHIHWTNAPLNMKSPMRHLWK